MILDDGIRNVLIVNLKELGLSATEIGKLFDEPSWTIYDILHKNGTSIKKLPDRFANALRRYIEIKDTLQDIPLLHVLKEYLGIVKLQNALIGCGKTLKILTICTGTGKYQKLVDAILATERTEVALNIDDFWFSLKSFPLSKDELFHAAFSFYAEKYRGEVKQLIPDYKLGEMFSIILPTLSPNQEKVLKLRYGLGEDGEIHTLSNIGERFGVGKERIRQIEAKALRILRHPSRIRELTGLYTNSKHKLDKEINTAVGILKVRWQDGKLAEPATIAISEIKSSSFETSSVDDWDLSVRAYNCMKNARISNGAELLQYSEKELMRTINFGKRSLQEIKYFLHGLGLQLKP